MLHELLAQMVLNKEGNKMSKMQSNNGSGERAVIGGKVYVAPNGVHKVEIFPHGYIQFPKDMPANVKDIIHDASLMAADAMGGNSSATPYEVFEAMGWTEVQ